MKHRIGIWSLTLVMLLALAPAARADGNPVMQIGSDWRKMSASVATTKAVEAMVLKNNFIHAEAQGNYVFGKSETATAFVQAVPCRDGVEIIVVVFSANGREAELLRNAIRAHVFDGPYDPNIPAKLDSKTPGRKSTAPFVHFGGAVRTQTPLLFEAAAHSAFLAHGLEAGVTEDDTWVYGTKPGALVTAIYTPLKAGQGYVSVLAASSNTSGEAETLRNAVRADIFANKLPAVVDLRQYQTAIRNQGGRGACPYFPPVAALEAAYKRKGTPVDLSVQHLIWLRDVTALGEKAAATRDQAESLLGSLTGGGANGSFHVLSKYAVCRWDDLPYIGDGDYDNYASKYYTGFGVEKYAWDKPFSQFLLNRWNFDPKQFPAPARLQAKYGVDRYVMLSDKNLHDVGKIEQVLASGHELVWSVCYHDDIWHTDPAQPVWRLKAGSEPMSLNHLTMIVGYDRARQFFIVKNQWGPTNYSAGKDKLAPGWKDIVKYDGYTLVDYNYLAECSEAGYVTAAAPVGSPRFTSQRALGQWQVTFTDKSSNKQLMTGVLSWRRLPNTANLPKADLRIGDLVTRDGKQYRVNAKLGGSAATSKVTLYIDCAHGSLPYDAAGGTAWTGNLTLPAGGTGSMNLAGTGSASLWGVSAGAVRLDAVQVDDRNLLKEMPVPH
jgi:hypothetical protein